MCLQERQSLPAHLKLDRTDWKESFLNNLQSYLKGQQLCPFLATPHMVLFLSLSILTTYVLPETHQNSHFPRLTKTLQALSSCVFFCYLPTAGHIVYGVPLAQPLFLLQGMQYTLRLSYLGIDAQLLSSRRELSHWGRGNRKSMKEYMLPMTLAPLGLGSTTHAGNQIPSSEHWIT